MQTLVLASSSKARTEILKKLKYPFTNIAPNIDESLKENETPEAHVKRLSIEKAKAVTGKAPDNALIIACDSICILNNKILSKPETIENARKQLNEASGKTIEFYTGVCVLNNSNKKFHTHIDKILVEYRNLTQEMIENYIKRDMPLDCAGSIRAESLGLALIEKIITDDPNSLVGLPLIKVIDLLKLEGLDILTQPS